MLLRLEGVARQIGSRSLFRDVSFHVNEGDRIGLVGANGAGKTTLLRIAAGLESADAGRVLVPRPVRVAMLRQEIDPTGQRTLREEAGSALAELDALEGELSTLEAAMGERGRAGEEVPAELAERYDRCRAAFEFGGGFEREARVERVLSGLGFDAESLERPLSAFSGGWLMRVELAKLLLSAPDVLLLDEPTNHLDLPSIQWFEETLGEYRGGVLLVSHDRTFLRRHATRVVELAAGKASVYDVDWERYLALRALRREEALARRRHQDRETAETERFIERFRYKASKARQVQSRIKGLERMERVEVEPEGGPSLRLAIPPPPRAGETVLTLAGIHKAYGEHVVYEGVDFSLRRGERVALAGANGAGKSTLLRIAAGALDCDRGERRVGHNVRAAFFAQHQLEAMDPNRSALEELASIARTEDVPRLRGQLGAFLFSGDDVDKKVSVLSGGEKARLALAKLLLRPANLLVLDEPTNHLDLSAREVLEGALRGYEGTLLFISHDRAFINALATRVVETRNGELVSHPGNYDDYLRSLRGDAPGSPPLPVRPQEGEGARVAAKRERMEARERARERTRALSRAKKRLAALEREIHDIEERQQTLTARLADPEVYRDGEAVRSVESERTVLRAELETRFAEWESLAQEVEAAEAG